MTNKAFTLVETLVAVTFLMVAIITPMSLTAQSLSVAYYARDQIVAFNLAQEAIETVRHLRDHNVLLNAYGTSIDLLSGIPATNGDPFTVDSRDDSMVLCSGTCRPLQTDGTLYGYSTGWSDSRYTRTVRAQFVGSGSDEVRISVTVSWNSGPYAARTFTISENLFRWVNDGAGA